MKDLRSPGYVMHCGQWWQAWQINGQVYRVGNGLIAYRCGKKVSATFVPMSGAL